MPPEITIIGTIHTDTIADELITDLARLQPDHIFVQLHPTYPSEGPIELQQVKAWAEQNGIAITCYDTYRDVPWHDGMSADNPRYQQFVDDQLAVLSGLDWKYTNTQAYRDQPDVAALQKRLFADIVCPEKWQEQQTGMVERIRSDLPERGQVVILTGAGNLGFYRDQFPTAHYLYGDI